MDKYTEQYINSMEKVYNSIMKRYAVTCEFRESDILFISMYQKTIVCPLAKQETTIIEPKEIVV